MEMEERRKKIDLTDIRVVLLLAGICCFLWGSATPAIKIGYRLFGIDGADTASILLFAGTLESGKKRCQYTSCSRGVVFCWPDCW